MGYLKKQPIETQESGMPHIYWDKGFTTNPNKSKELINNHIENTNRIKVASGYPNLTKEELMFKRIRDWAFYIIVCLVAVYAIYRVLKGILF
jgi:hypothetical protein